MKNILISAIAIITLGMAATEADAQFYVVKDGKVVYDLSDLPDSVTFEKPSFTVTFDSGEDATTVDVQYNATADKPTDPQREGYDFKGWYNGEELFDFAQPINGDVKLTAKWQEVSAVAIPDAVDLGLSVKWASFNIGASAPEEYGDYFAWGELEPHYADGHSLDDYCNDWLDGYDGYNWANYKFTEDGGSTFKKYTIDGTTELEDADDVAVQRLGGDWQMPTETDWQELIDNCTWEWTTLNGVKGCKFTSKKEGYTNKYIFLPAAGYRDGAGLDYVGSNGKYWSRSLYAYGSYGARYLYFDSGNGFADSNNRYRGLSVRAVQRK